MPTNTTVKGLNINELTEAQYDAAVQGGVIGPNELSVLTDVSYVEPSDLATVATTGDYDDLINKPTIPAAIQVSNMPVASVDELDKIYQFIGATDATYTNGYFYKCVSDGQTPATYSWEQTDVMPAGSSLPDQTGNAGKFLTTDGTDASWSDKPLVNNATDTTSLAIGGTIGASNVRSVVIGQNANTTANWATVIGSMATSLATDTVSIGYGTIQSGGRYSIGIGEFGTGVAGGINAQNSIAIVPRMASVVQLTAHDTIVLGAVYSFSGLKNNTFYVGLGVANGQTYELLSADGTIPTARFTTDPVSDGTYYPTLTITSGVATRSWSAPSGGLPSQTGNAGKFLTTDGTDASWSDKPLVNNDTHTGSVSISSNTSGSYNTVLGRGSSSYGGNYNTVVGSTSQARNASVAIGVGIQDSTSQNAVIIRSGTQNMGSYVTGITDSFTWIKGTTQYELVSGDGTIPAARHAALPATDGTYTLQLVITDGVPTLSWVAV